MANEFVSLGGYGVKDPIARAAVEALESKTASDIQTLQGNMSNAINVVQQNHDTDMQELRNSVSDELNAMHDNLTEEANAMKNEIDTKMDELIEESENMQAYVTPQMFGAVGDGVTDDSTIFNAVLDYARAKKIKVECEQSDVFLINSSF